MWVWVFLGWAYGHRGSHQPAWLMLPLPPVHLRENSRCHITMDVDGDKTNMSINVLYKASRFIVSLLHKLKSLHEFSYCCLNILFFFVSQTCFRQKMKRCFKTCFLFLDKSKNENSLTHSMQTETRRTNAQLLCVYCKCETSIKYSGAGLFLS